MIQNISRYVSVFTIAMSTSLITLLALIIGEILDWPGKHYMLMLIITSVDSAVNVTCLYLQYPFNNTIYKQLCILVDQQWEKYFIKWTKSNIKNEYQKKMTMNATTNECEIVPIVKQIDND